MDKPPVSRKSFVFFASFRDSIEALPSEYRYEMCAAIYNYALESEMPEFSNSLLMPAFLAMKPNIDASNQRYDKCVENGKKGGAPRGNQNARKQSNNNQETTENNQETTENNQETTENNLNKDKDKNRDMDIDKDLDEDRDRDACQRVADMFNASCPSLPCIRTLSDKRIDAVSEILKSHSMADIQRAFELAEASSFLCGQNDRGWSATFDWLMAGDNLEKVMEGNYTDKKCGTASEAQPKATGNIFLDLLHERGDYR